jgi:protein-disulfide isomerase
MEDNLFDFDQDEKKEEKKEEEVECEVCKEYNYYRDKKVKNLLSAVILLAGLLVGSLFVDVAQLYKGGGFSQKNLSKSDIFEAGGKTWVAYSEGAVPAAVITDDTCEKCDVSEALVWLRRVLPTVSSEKIAYDSKEGKAMIEKYGIKTLPAFIFDGAIAKTDFYTQAKVLFSQKEDRYVMNTQELGLPVGKYLDLPKIGEGDAVFGPEDAKVKVVIFSDFQCPYCKVFFQTLRANMKQYGDKVRYAFKELPLDIHPQANNAALAAMCAQEQGKFWEYADKLYATQSDWGMAKDTAKLKTYARTLGLKADDFNKCLDDKKYQDKVDSDKKEATDFGISGTPSIFINDQFESGAVTADQLKANIEAQLNK